MVRVGHNQILVIVVVEIAQGHEYRLIQTITDGIRDCRLKDTSARTQHHTYRMIARKGCNQVKFSITVEVTHRNRTKVSTLNETHSRLEDAGASTKKYA